jgi:hypothetical protein
VKHSQIVQIPDQALNEKLIPANDNYQLTSPSMESIEAGSILAPRAYTEPGKRSHLGLIVACGIAAIVLVIVYVGPLLN